MKTYIKTAFVAMLTLYTAAAEANSAKTSSSFQQIENKAEPLTQQEANILVSRIYDINAMDRSTLTRAQKLGLRKELLQIRNQLNNPVAGGIYISAGALILILILLIIFL